MNFFLEKFHLKYNISGSTLQKTGVGAQPSQPSISCQILWIEHVWVPGPSSSGSKIVRREVLPSWRTLLYGKSRRNASFCPLGWTRFWTWHQHKIQPIFWTCWQNEEDARYSQIHGGWRQNFSNPLFYRMHSDTEEAMRSDLSSVFLYLSVYYQFSFLFQSSFCLASSEYLGFTGKLFALISPYIVGNNLNWVCLIQMLILWFCSLTTGSSN